MNGRKVLPFHCDLIDNHSGDREGNADFIVTLTPKDFPQERLRAKVISPEAMA
jgi:hypothetical protein